MARPPRRTRDEILNARRVPLEAAYPDWHELEDAELRSRLMARGCDAGMAKIISIGRNQRDYAADINSYLADDDDAVTIQP